MELKTFFDFCSGIGAGRLGLEQCGLSCVGHSDTSRLADTTYRLLHHANDEKNYGNLKKLSGQDLPKYDVLIAGFPCQTFSVIGRKEGFNDDRGQIIFHLSRLLRESKPKCFILENVKGLVTHDDGKTIKTILNELDNSGYITSYRVIASLDCGVPQMRQRVYFVGIDKTLGLDIKNFKWPEPVAMPALKNFLIDEDNAPSELDLWYFMKYLNNPTNIGKNYQLQNFLEEEYLILDTRMNDMRLYRGKVPTLRAQRDGIYYVKDHKLRLLTGYEALLLQGFPKEYADRVKKVVDNRHLLMQAGNAMTVNVIQMLGQKIVDFFKEENMTVWEKFENDSTKYLNDSFGAYAQFTHMGGSNSTVSDIHVQTNTGKEFYIDAKHAPAQCGQFVLLPNIHTEKFEYSSQNTTPLTPAAQAIIDHMNLNFEAYKEAGTGGKDIDLNDNGQIFSQWIIETYSRKKAKFFITNNFTILPINDFIKHFHVTATYRVKRSGSSSVGKTNISAVSKYIANLKYPITNFTAEDNKLFIESARDLHNIRFIYGNYEYMFSRRDTRYEVRKLSNTFNANVIFSIDKKLCDGLSKNEFIDFLK